MPADYPTQTKIQPRWIANDTLDDCGQEYDRHAGEADHLHSQEEVEEATVPMRSPIVLV